jgi:hypothetical protein
VSCVSRQSYVLVLAIFVAGLICGTSIRPVVADDTIAPATLPSPDSSGLSEVQSPAASPELPCYRVRRFDPYVTPDPRSCAPSLVEAIGSGLLPPFGWGWYGIGYPGWGWGYGGWGYGGWGYGGWGGPRGAYGNYPYRYGFNGSFWYPHGSSWPYPSFSNWVYGGPRYLAPLSLPVYPLYPFPYPYGPVPAADDWAPHLGQYYW